MTVRHTGHASQGLDCQRALIQCNFMPTVECAWRWGCWLFPLFRNRQRKTSLPSRQSWKEGTAMNQASLEGSPLSLNFEVELLGCSLYIIKLRPHPSLVFPFQYQLSPYVGEKACEQFVVFPEFVLAFTTKNIDNSY